MSAQMSSELNDILSSFSNAIDIGYSSSNTASSGTSSRFGSVRLRGGSESRKQIPIQFLESVASRNSLIENSIFSSTYWPEVVEPLDVEQEIENQVAIASNKDENFQLIADYPKDDLQIVFEEKHCRTFHDNVPEDQSNLTSATSSCINAYKRNYTYVKRNYETLALESQKALLATPKLEQNLPKVDYEEDEEKNSPQKIGSVGEKVGEVTPGSLTSSDDILQRFDLDYLSDEVFHTNPRKEEIDEQNTRSRGTNRRDDLLSMYARWQNSAAQSPLNTAEESSPVEKRPIPPPPVEQFAHRFLVRCLSLEFETDFEPIFVSMALYDTKHKKKISENFYTELNCESSRKLVKDNVEASIYSLARAAVFSVSNLSHDIHLVIKLEKVLQQGDITDCVEPYMRDATEKVRDKARQNAKWFCDRLGNYRMPFAWTSIDVMKVMSEAADLRPYENGQRTESFSTDSICDEDETASLRDRTLTRSSHVFESDSNLFNTFKAFTVKLSFCYRQESERLKEEELLKLLCDVRRQSQSLKKLKCIPCELKLDISRYTPNTPFCVTTDLLHVKPYPDPRARPIREILEFPAIDGSAPYTTFRNILYVYPLSVNFTNRPNHSRNITVKVQLLASEDLTKALKSIYGKSNSPNFVSEAYTAVSYHNKNPDFNEEVKIQLPVKLTSQHHLFFSFFHISCQRKQDIHPIEIPLGYTWIPLLACGRLNVGEMNLPVCVDRPTPHYSIRKNNETLPGIKWVDGRKPVFNVMLRAASTVHMPDRHLNKFFDMCHIVEQPSQNSNITSSLHPSTKLLPDGTRINDVAANMKQALDELARKTPDTTLAKFLYVILDKIISMIIRPPIFPSETVGMGENCFEALITISSRLHSSPNLRSDHLQRNVIMCTYLHYLLSTPPNESSLAEPSNSNGKQQQQQSESSEANGINGSGDSSSKSLNYYATMTRGERNRPSMTTATFNMSSSNPDLTRMMPQDSNPSPLNSIMQLGNGDFMRMSAARSSMMEQGNVKTETNLTSVRTVSKKILHEEIVLFFVVSTSSVREKAMQNAWFLFEMISKSMALHLYYNGRLNSGSGSGRSCFPRQYLDELHRLVRFVSNELLARCDKECEYVDRLNTAFAFLLYDLFSLVNRTYTMQLVHLHYQQMNEKLSHSPVSKPNRILLQLRAQFTRILCSHEHYVMLNLPLILPPSPPSPTLSIISSISTLTSATTLTKSNSRYELTEQFQKQHYLAGLLLSDIKRSIELVEQGNASALKMQAYSIETLKNLLTSHDYDKRINSSQQVKQTVARLYQPLFTITLQALPIMYTHGDEEKNNSAAASNSSSEDGLINPNVASAIANPFNPKTITSRKNTGKLQMTAESTRDLLVCFFWLLKNTEHAMLKTWWGSLPYSHIILLLEVIYVALACFELKKPEAGGATMMMMGSRNASARSSNNFGPASSRIKTNKSRLEGVIRGENSARQEMLNRRRAGTGGDKTLRDGLRWNKNQTEWKQNKENSERERNVIDDSPHSRLFSSETSMMSLDAIQLVVESTFESGCGVARSVATFQIISSVFRVLLQLFSKRQSVEVLQHAFAIQRSLVSKFPEHLFDEDTEQCGDLAAQLLHKCSSASFFIRQHAAASLYMLMRHNQLIGNSFSKVRMQVTMSMSSLVGVSQNFHEQHLRSSLNTVLSYAQRDASMADKEFPKQVSELINNLDRILSDTIKMKEHREDPEMLIDLMYRIAKGYRTSPNLRLTWLHNMAKQHTERKNFVEAGMCYLHCAGLVSEYLALIEYKSYLPTGCAGFEDISSNVLEESVICDDMVTTAVCDMSADKIFSIAGLTSILEKSIKSFNEGGLYEVVAMVSEHTKKIYEHQKSFDKLKDMYAKLQNSFAKISSQSSYGGWERMFGTYFRVAFYGSKFGDLNGEQFVYKEPAITKLPEISHRLETFYSGCFGEENVSVLKDSSEVDVNKLDVKKAYIQITYVEPYFYEFEERFKKSYFERNFNMDKFVYATPFTKDGKAHGEMKDQYKRKTFLQVANSFPYIKTRVNVVKKWEKVLTPLQSACEDIKKKTSDLMKAVNMNPPDVRMLQINLQGAVMTAVNQGPMHVANTFLTDFNDPHPEHWKSLNDIRLAFKKFLHVCHLALKANKKLIKSDQQEYHKEMERNYQKMSEQLRPLVADRKVVSNIQKLHLSERC